MLLRTQYLGSRNRSGWSWGEDHRTLTVLTRRILLAYKRPPWCVWSGRVWVISWVDSAGIGCRRSPALSVCRVIWLISLCVYLTPRPVMIGNSTTEWRHSQNGALVSVGKGSTTKPNAPMGFAPRARELGKFW